MASSQEFSKEEINLFKEILSSNLLLIEGGLYISKEILIRECQNSETDLDELLKRNESKLKDFFRGEQYKKLYPDSGKANINCWNIQLTIGVLLNVFGRSIRLTEKEKLQELRDLRNDIYMHCTSASLDVEDFEDLKKKVVDIITTLASNFDETVQERCSKYIKEFTTGKFDGGVNTETIAGDTSRNRNTIAEEILLKKTSIDVDSQEVIKSIRRNFTSLNEKNYLKTGRIEVGSVREFKIICESIPEPGRIEVGSVREFKIICESIPEPGCVHTVTPFKQAIRETSKDDDFQELKKSIRSIRTSLNEKKNLKTGFVHTVTPFKQAIRETSKDDDFQELKKSIKRIFTSLNEKKNLKTVSTDDITGTAIKKIFGPISEPDLSGWKKKLDEDKTDESLVQESDPFIYSWKIKDVKSLIRQGKLPTQRTLDEMCLVLGRKSKVIKLMCKAICEDIKTKRGEISHVWAAYTIQKPDRITFVIHLKEIVNNATKPLRLEKLIKYSFVKRYFGDFNPESTEILKQQKSSKGLDEEALQALQQCFSKHSEDLMTKHKYLSILSASSHRSKGFGSSSSWILVPENCIVFYVHTKGYIPIAEDPFETNYDGIPVDVREGAFIPFGRTATDILDPVRMGCQISGDSFSGKYVEGTLGCFIDHPQFGCCGLTCAHVLLRPWELHQLRTVHNGTLKWPLHKMSKNVYQPSNQSSSIGHTVQFIYKEGSNINCGMELALFRIIDRQPNSAGFPDANAGSSAANGINYDNWRLWSPDRLNKKNCHVVKFGSKTEFRDGIIVFNTVSVKELDCYPLRSGDAVIKLFKQIEVEPHTSGLDFASYGDSGAPVFLVEGNNKHACIGIVEGGTSHGTVVVTPIVPILEELNVPCLKSFDLETNFSTIHDQVNRLEVNVQTSLQNMQAEIQNIDSKIQAGNQVVQTMSNDLQMIKQLLLNHPR